GGICGGVRFPGLHTAAMPGSLRQHIARLHSSISDLCLGTFLPRLDSAYTVLMIGGVLTVVALWRKSLVPGMIAHGLGDSLVAFSFFFKH
ncbi:MAG: hypothetical protein M3Z85_17980, partial [Acidobacteriota bacterium]|nr:hypothetical protein [Acidobacteriota bacterium]